MNQRLRLFVLFICIALLNSGCMGMVMRNIAIDDAKVYSEFSESLPAIPEGKGRIFIYMVDGGPSVLNTLGIVGAALTIDDNVQFISGKTFFYADLDIGKHEVTASKVVSGVFKITFDRGENVIDFVLSDQQVRYVKIDFRGYIGTPRFGTYHPILLESNQDAETEINDLKFYLDHNYGMLGDRAQIWKVGDTC